MAYPVNAVRKTEAIELGEYRANNHEKAHRKDHAENKLLLQGKFGPNQDWKRDAQHHKVRRDVENRVHNQMIVIGRALRVGSWHGPVVVEWSAPNSEEKDFHDTVAKNDICTNNGDEEGLFRSRPGKC
jgi:hypothetical protein